MFSYLINIRDEETRKPAYDITELCEEANMLTAAGANTTSVVIAAMFFYLIHDSEIREKLTTEICTTFTSVDEHQIWKAAPILSIPVGLNRQSSTHGTRTAAPNRAVKYCLVESALKTSSIISGDVYTIHHNPEIFPDPFRFQPERWIVGNGVTAEDVGAREGAVFVSPFDVLREQRPLRCPLQARHYSLAPSSP
ncbi:hypothetical protein EJ04DRAFT_598455 [Polyplosphaeria fusca]|uniref:Cytochrome P450 n=1 Tax=Polyplosphaeria fusca TaxID=682080 RepID=A0A9P4R323_9PLEO|nr:hypothetical protein EJ04DRAFT_598455 [Polyplosphaeria fusca]